MILLIGALDVLRVVTTSTSAIDVVAGFADHSGGVITPSRQLTTITTAATTTVVSAPGSGVQRTIRFLTIRNRGGAANTVTLELFNGSAAFQVHSLTLASGEALTYDAAAGFLYLSAQGLPKTAQSQGGQQAAVNALNIVVLGANVVNNNAVANTMQDVTGLSFAVLAGEGYLFRATIPYTAAVGTTGSRWSINGPASPTILSYRSKYSLTVTSETVNAGLTAYDLPAASNATSPTTTGNMAVVEGFIQPSANGTVVVRFASEVANSAITALRGATLEWVRVY